MEFTDAFPIGTRFYEWNTLPMATVLGPKGRLFLNFAADPPTEIKTLSGLRSVREISREDFDVLRAQHDRLFAHHGTERHG